jgi:hypothetical protein
MESILNVVWILVGVGLFATLRPKTRQVKIALLCAVVLLFPIISVSDDLSAAADRTLEEAALLVPLMLVIIALMALALLDMPRVHWRRVVLPVQSDPRSPPRR